MDLILIPFYTWSQAANIFGKHRFMISYLLADYNPSLSQPENKRSQVMFATTFESRLSTNELYEHRIWVFRSL